MKVSFRAFLLILPLAVACFLGHAPRAHAQVSEFFDDFFSDNGGQPAQNFKGFLQWNVTDPANTTNSSVDFVGGTVLGAFAYPDGRFVDLGGSTNQPAVFSTKLSIVLAVGVTYNLSFRYVSTEALLELGGPGSGTVGTPAPANPLDTAMATISGQTFTFSTNSSDFQMFSQDFVATSSTTLAFQDLGFTDPKTGLVTFDNSGVGIDGVLIAPAIAGVPEPGVMAALASGCVVAGAVMARKCRSIKTVV